VNPQQDLEGENDWLKDLEEPSSLPVAVVAPRAFVNKSVATLIISSPESGALKERDQAALMRTTSAPAAASVAPPKLSNTTFLLQSISEPLVPLWRQPAASSMPRVRIMLDQGLR
jgi:hypothetical protein